MDERVNKVKNSFKIAHIEEFNFEDYRTNFDMLSLE